MSRNVKPILGEIHSAVAYVRVSSEEQADAARYSLPQQRKSIEAYCKSRGWQIAEWYADEGVSAKTDNIKKRPAFHRMITDLQEGRVQAQVIVTHTLDRFARNLMLAINTLKDMSKLGIIYSSVTEADFDYANPDKRMHLQILAMFAEYFSEKLSQHTIKGKRGRHESGLLNGDLPYGYQNPNAGTELSSSGVYNSDVPVQVEREAEAVQLAFSWYADEQLSDAKIAKRLNELGYRMRSKRHPAGCSFSKDTITAMLTNPTYAGWVTRTAGWSSNRAVDAERVPGRHAPIVEQLLFDRVQAARKGRRPEHQNKAQFEQMKGTYPLAGLVVCAHCGGSLRVQSQARGAYYRCTASERGEACAATKRSIRDLEADRQIAEIVTGLRLAPDWKARAMAAAGMDVDKSRVEAERATITRRLEKIRRFVIDEVMTEEEYQRERIELGDRLARLVVPAELDLDEAGALLEHLTALWLHPATTQEQRKGFCGRVFARVIVDTDSGLIKEIHLREGLATLFAVLPEQVYTPSGSDGIRTRGLLRDRQAC
jgi:site-specific DNA recombinase